MLFGWKRNKNVIHPCQKSPWTCRQKTWVVVCHSHTVFSYHNLPAFLRGEAIRGIQATLFVSFATGVLIRVAGNHGVCPPYVDPEEKFPSNFRAQITGALLSVNYTDKAQLQAQSVREEAHSHINCLFIANL